MGAGGECISVAFMGKPEVFFFGRKGVVLLVHVGFFGGGPFRGSVGWLVQTGRGVGRFGATRWVFFVQNGGFLARNGFFLEFTTQKWPVLYHAKCIVTGCIPHYIYFFGLAGQCSGVSMVS